MSSCYIRFPFKSTYIRQHFPLLTILNLSLLHLLIVLYLVSAVSVDPVPTFMKTSSIVVSESPKLDIPRLCRFSETYISTGTST